MSVLERKPLLDIQKIVAAATVDKKTEMEQRVIRKVQLLQATVRKANLNVEKVQADLDRFLTLVEQCYTEEQLLDFCRLYLGQ